MKPPKDDSGQVWFKLVQWFQRRRLFNKFTDGRRTPSDGNSSHRWAKKGNNSKMGKGIYLKIAVYVDLDMLHIFAI
jgi:hypothetical protein